MAEIDPPRSEAGRGNEQQLESSQPLESNQQLNKGLVVVAQALGLFMAIVGGFIALIAALLGMIQWISDESQGYSFGAVLVWFSIGIVLAIAGGFIARIRDPGAPVDRPDSWAAR